MICLNRRRWSVYVKEAGRDGREDEADSRGAGATNFWNGAVVAERAAERSGAEQAMKAGHQIGSKMRERTSSATTDCTEPPLTFALVQVPAGLHFGMQRRVKQLPRRGRLEQLHKGRDDALPFLRREFADIGFEQLLKARSADPCQCVVLYEASVRERRGQEPVRWPTHPDIYTPLGYPIAHPAILAVL